LHGGLSIILFFSEYIKAFKNETTILACRYTDIVYRIWGCSETMDLPLNEVHATVLDGLRSLFGDQ